MNSRTPWILAIALVIGSAVLAVLALRIRHPPEVQPVTAPPASPHAEIVVAARPIQSGDEIGALDVRLEPMDPMPSDAFENPGEVVGKRPFTAIAAGQPVLQSHFGGGNLLAGVLGEDERAVAVKVDGLIGGGGFLRPGNKVDVLIYLRDDNQPNKQGQSLVVVPSARVLAYGDEAASAEAGDKKEKPRSKGATAMLAVSARDAIRLHFAEHAGRLRLALRSASGGSVAEDCLPVGSNELGCLGAPEPEGVAMKEPKARTVTIHRLKSNRIEKEDVSVP